MSVPNVNHEKFKGYGYGNMDGKDPHVRIYYRDDDNDLTHMKFDQSWQSHIKFLYMKVCDMYDMGMSIEDIQTYYDL